MTQLKAARKNQITLKLRDSPLRRDFSKELMQNVQKAGGVLKTLTQGM